MMGTGFASNVLFRAQLTGMSISLLVSLPSVNTLSSSITFLPKLKGEEEGIKYKMDIDVSQPHQTKDVPKWSKILDQMSRWVLCRVHP